MLDRCELCTPGTINVLPAGSQQIGTTNKLKTTKEQATLRLCFHDKFRQIGLGKIVTLKSSPTRLAVAKDSRNKIFIVTTRRGRDNKGSKVGPRRNESTFTRSHTGGETGRIGCSSLKERTRALRMKLS